MQSNKRRNIQDNEEDYQDNLCTLQSDDDENAEKQIKQKRVKSHWPKEGFKFVEDNNIYKNPKMNIVTPKS